VPDGVVIRLLTGEDAPAYAALRAEMVVREPHAFLAAPGDDHAGDAESVRRYLAREEHAIAGAFLAGAGGLVGVAGVYREARVKRRHRAAVWGVYTTPAARGRGVGRRLMEACLALAGSWRGVEVIGLSASVRSEAAIRLYESVGFRRWGVEPDCIRVEGEALDEVHMQRRV
jgi:RimJ/RimL family protein N-acetyltransferase